MFLDRQSDVGIFLGMKYEPLSDLPPPLQSKYLSGAPGVLYK